ncbi:glycosyltransferase [Microbacterium sp.]|uniref:glycosyltransferase n=1 Tax=Microbacterium sp. TaxID=51671 RepID=UPI0026292555|nr:glycosyltransferase [Microbacterium sp.]
MPDASRPRVLCISFSDINADSRVLRQLAVLAEDHHVTTLCYGSRPEHASDHIEIDRNLPSLPQTLSGVVKLGLRRFRSVQWEAPATRVAIEKLGDRQFDIVVANEARALPLAFRIAGTPRIWCDLHEWAPAERTHVLSWRLLVAPFMRWICAEYLPRVDAATTINESIADMYRDDFGVEAEIVRNAIGYRADLAPRPVQEDTVRLVHSGGAVPGRNIEAIIDAVDELGEGYTLDLYLIASRDGSAYWRGLRQQIANSERTTLHDPVSPEQLPDALNEYDLGVFLLPPLTPNHRHMLPNKFFDFVQARLGLVFGTSVETDRIISSLQLGVVTQGYGAQDIVSAVRALSRADIEQFKKNADAAAEALSSRADIATERGILDRLS